MLIHFSLHVCKYICMSMKTECDFLFDWIKKTVTYVTYTKISTKMVNPRDLAGIREGECVCVCVGGVGGGVLGNSAVLSVNRSFQSIN